MGSQTITINISDAIYSQLERAAKLSKQPIEMIVEQSLSHSLPPLLEDIPVEYQPNIFPLLQMNRSQLENEAKQMFNGERWEEYEKLLDKQKRESLDESERERLDQLRREADVVTFRKAYAAVLLKRRGYSVPVQNLPTAE